MQIRVRHGVHALTIIACLFAPSPRIEAGLVKSHTFFSVRPNFQSAMPERVSLFRNELLDECQGFGGAFEVVPYGSAMSDQGKLKLALFFLPPGCTSSCLNVLEYNPVREENPTNTDDVNPLKNLEARNFNIETVNQTFASTICIEPSQRKFGLGLCYKQALSHKNDGTTGFWFEGSMPIERVENRVRLTETITNDGGGPADVIGLDNSPRVGSMTAAFAQCNWLYGRIVCDKHVKWGVADVELKVGYDSCNCETYSTNSYVGLIIPTGPRIHNKLVFEPVVGNNHHFGVSFGTSFSFQLWCKHGYTFMMYIDGDTRYLFANNQIRSFDLIGKPWSRYQETYKTSEDAAQAYNTTNPNSGTSGINIFTRCVRVSPHLASNANTCLLLSRQSNCASWGLEVGYNLFVRQSEVLELECSNTIAASALKAINGVGSTTVARNIKQNFPASEFTFPERYAALSNCDIDLESASHPATISSIFYGVLGYRWEKECPGFVGLGGSYEWTVNKINTSLDRWLIWAKIGVTF